MIDINSTDFISRFKIADATVGVVGHGFVGKAVDSFFKKACKTLVYDKVKPELQTLEDVVLNSEVIFVCVPTPMNQDGSCHTGIVESVLDSIKETAKRVGRNLSTFITVIKSTVNPGFTEEMQDRHFDMRIAFSPEFLTEKNSIQDFENQNRIIIGADEEDALVVFKYFEGVDPVRVAHDKLTLWQCYPTVAEMVKLYANGMLATKVLFSNEVFLMCEKLGIEYEEVRSLACLDRRIGSGHTLVPGHDGQLGFGGHCFPKDLQNLRYVARSLGTNEKLLTAIIERNEEVREDHDWKKMKGRAVVQ